MGSDKSFAGKWQGQYTYGEGYGDRLKGKSGAFTIFMDVSGDGRLTGKCLDEGATNQMEAIIVGRIIHGDIEFTKKYRHHWKTDREGNMSENRDRESHEVIYSGRFQNEVFSGEWKIFTRSVRADGSIADRVIGGYWIMHRGG